jgi:hypothetical protein
MTPWPLRPWPPKPNAASFKPKRHVRRWKNRGAKRVTEFSRQRREQLATRVWVVVSNLVVPESLISHRSPTYSNLWIKKRLDIFKNNPGEKFQSVGPADWSDWINLTCALLLDMPTLGGRTTGKCHAPTPRLPLEHVGPLHVILLGSKAPHEQIKSRILGRSHRCQRQYDFMWM